MASANLSSELSIKLKNSSSSTSAVEESTLEFEDEENYDNFGQSQSKNSEFEETNESTENDKKTDNDDDEDDDDELSDTPMSPCVERTNSLDLSTCEGDNSHRPRTAFVNGHSISLESLNLDKEKDSLADEIFENTGISSFDVIKFNKKKTLAGSKKRIWKIDHVANLMSNMNKRGVVKKTHLISNLRRVERHPQKTFTLLLYLKDVRYPYELYFESISELERCYETLLACKVDSMNYSPYLSSKLKSQLPQPENQQEKDKFVTIALNGTFVDKSLEKKNKKLAKPEAGTMKINISDSQYHDLTVFCGTMNMSQNPPPNKFQDFEDFVKPGADIYCLTFEESTYNTNVGYNDILTYCDKFFEENPNFSNQNANNSNPKKSNYVQLLNVVLWEIKIIIFVRRQFYSLITCVEGSKKPTGFLNICGNKGGVAISFKFMETSFCFLGSHLAAKEEKLYERNEDAFAISSGNALKIGYRELDISQFDYVFWMGDLNYRLDLPFELCLEEIKKCVKDNEEVTPDKKTPKQIIDYLLEHDQLKDQMKKGNVFNGFTEGTISFFPTYKFEYGPPIAPVEDLIGRNYTLEKMRTPSYCDRILFMKTNTALKLEQTEYKASTKIYTSDHSPVYSIFKVGALRRFLNIFEPISGIGTLPNQKNDPKPKKIEIIFSNMYISGRSGMHVVHKPQISFYSPFLEKCPVESKTTKPKNAIVNPSFSNGDIPVLKPIFHNFEFLKTQKILIVIRDKKDAENDIIGIGCLCLNDFFVVKEENAQKTITLNQNPVKLSLSLTYKLMDCGKMNAQVQIIQVPAK